MRKVALLVGAALLACGCGRQAPEHEHVRPEDGAVRIPLARVDDGGVHFFTYPFASRNVNFFVRSDRAGRLHAHFDACYGCFKYKLGYVWEEDQVVCIACRIGYDLEDELWDYVGACAPITLRSRTEGDFLIIDRTHIEKGLRFF